MKRKSLTLRKVLSNFSSFIGVGALTLTLASCNVHEWPEDLGERYTFTLIMDFDKELPLHKEVTYTRDSKADPSLDEQANYDIRYLVRVYRVKDENDANREVFETHTFTRPSSEAYNHQVQLNLPEGNYRFRVWSDHVAKGTEDDHFYSTVDFADIKILADPTHPGANEFRDAFRGSAYGSVYDPELYQINNGRKPDHSATAEMRRPMGRYEFISTDMDEFLDKLLENLDPATKASMLEMAASRTDTKGEIFWNGLTRDEVAEALGLDKYTVVFSYNAFMPNSYNIYTDKPSDSATGVSYESKMLIADQGMALGFDYILVDDETTMNMNLAVYDDNDELVSATSGVQVPVARSKNTIVKGAFLTVTSGGGVAINPGFEGPDFDIEIK